MAGTFSIRQAWNSMLPDNPLHRVEMRYKVIEDAPQMGNIQEYTFQMKDGRMFSITPDWKKTPYTAEEIVGYAKTFLSQGPDLLGRPFELMDNFQQELKKQKEAIK